MKRRSRILASVFVALLIASRANAHGEHHGNHVGADYYAVLDDFHVVSTTEATGEIFLNLNEARTELSYEIHLDDLLGLKENPLDRTQPDDIIGIHLHLSVEGTNGPHMLNIFGLAAYNMPAEDDADLHIDYDNQILTGKWDISDASRDPNTGELLPQSFPLTSKVITNWLDELDDGRLMVAVHTNESGFPAMAIHGHIHAVAPEPAAGALMLAGIFCSGLMARRRIVRATALVSEV